MYFPAGGQSTTSYNEGCCDVIVVRHEDGTLVSTPFIVRFTHILTSKPVQLVVNGQKTSTVMKINERNEGYFELTETELPDPNMRSSLQKFLDPTSQSKPD